MRLFNVRGKLVYKNVKPYLIDWDASCRSKIQKKVQDFFRQYWSKHLVYSEFPVYGSLMKVDLLNATKKIAVETQGVQHNEFNSHFHKNRMNYFFSIKRDVKKAEWLEKNGFKLIEIEEKDIPLLSPEYIRDKFEVYIL
jgi:hypothetical protein